MGVLYQRANLGLGLWNDRDGRIDLLGDPGSPQDCRRRLREMKTFAERLLFLLERANVLPDSLFAMTGIETAETKELLSGRRLPSLQTVLSIASALSIEPGVLLDGIEV